MDDTTKPQVEMHADRVTNDGWAQENRVKGDGPAAIGILVLTILFILMIVVFVV